jgi:hypothetical protein
MRTIIWNGTKVKVSNKVKQMELQAESFENGNDKLLIIV